MALATRHSVFSMERLVSHDKEPSWHDRLPTILEFYIHSTAIKKWDLCAGDALIRSAGGALIDLEGQNLDYSADTSPLNKHGLIMTARNPFSTLSKIKSYLS